MQAFCPLKFILSLVITVDKLIFFFRVITQRFLNRQDTYKIVIGDLSIECTWIILSQVRKHATIILLFYRKKMNSIQTRHIISIGLALFAMLFGAGNLIYPLQVSTCGNLTWYGLAGFMITAVCLPFAGLIGILLFDGNYRSFYGRLGTVPSRIFLFISIMLIGPLLAIPRTVALAHVMIAPFLPGFLNQITTLSSFVFALIFLGLTFLVTCRENKIVSLLGNVISPLLVLSLAII